MWLELRAKGSLVHGLCMLRNTMSITGGIFLHKKDLQVGYSQKPLLETRAMYYMAPTMRPM